MHSFQASNVNEAMDTGVRYIQLTGKRETSRNGVVLVAPEPVCTVNMHPMQHVSLSPVRDANPFFHVVESAWMLAGRNDLALLQRYSSNFGAYSDDGVTLHGAYGHRWRRHFGIDQLPLLIEELRAHPDSRRCVLEMWDARTDLPMLAKGGKDVPCNTHAYFDLRGGVLNMAVCNRSNDAIWGAYGANAVHFSFLQEYLAANLDVPVGVYRQVSNNLHIYTEKFSEQQLQDLTSTLSTLSPYPHPHRSLMHGDVAALDADLASFQPGNVNFEPASRWFLELIVPVMRVWELRKAKASILTQVDACDDIVPADWARACREWIERRIK